MYKDIEESLHWKFDTLYLPSFSLSLFLSFFFFYSVCVYIYRYIEHPHWKNRYVLLIKKILVISTKDSCLLGWLKFSTLLSIHYFPDWRNTRCSSPRGLSIFANWHRLIIEVIVARELKSRATCKAATAAVTTHRLNGRGKRNFLVNCLLPTSRIPRGHGRVT